MLKDYILIYRNVEVIRLVFYATYYAIFGNIAIIIYSRIYRCLLIDKIMVTRNNDKDIHYFLVKLLVVETVGREIVICVSLLLQENLAVCQVQHLLRYRSCAVGYQRRAIQMILVEVPYVSDSAIYRGNRLVPWSLSVARTGRPYRAAMSVLKRDVYLRTKLVNYGFYIYH